MSNTPKAKVSARAPAPAWPPILQSQPLLPVFKIDVDVEEPVPVSTPLELALAVATEVEDVLTELPVDDPVPTAVLTLPVPVLVPVLVMAVRVTVLVPVVALAVPVLVLPAGFTHTRTVWQVPVAHLLEPQGPERAVTTNCAPSGRQPPSQFNELAHAWISEHDQPVGHLASLSQL